MNKITHLCGATLSVIALSSALYFGLEDIYNVYKLESDTIEVSYFFSILPVLLWILTILFLGIYHTMSKNKLHLSQNTRKTLGVTFPCTAIALSLILAFTLKPVFVSRLLNNGYVLEHTNNASAPWRYDVDVFTRIK